jgi:hypothetical protein
MKILAKIAAWYLQKRMEGYVIDTVKYSGEIKGGWIYGNGWHVNFYKNKLVRGS